MQEELSEFFREFQAISTEYIKALEATNSAAVALGLGPCAKAMQAWIEAFDREVTVGERRACIVEKIIQMQSSAKPS